MNFLAELLTNPSLKRYAVGTGTAALIALNKKLGLGMDSTEIIALVSLAIAFIGQSAAKEVIQSGQDAAAKVTTTSEAVTIINETKGP